MVASIDFCWLTVALIDFLIDFLFATPIPVLIENTFTTFKYSSFNRAYHAHKDVRIFIIGDDLLTCKQEEYNENDKNAVGIIWYHCILEKLVGHVPLKWSKVASKFLQFTNHDIRVEVTGKRVNHGVALGPKNTCNLFFYEDSWVITWVKNSLEKVNNEFYIKSKEMHQIKTCAFFFPDQS